MNGSYSNSSNNSKRETNNIKYITNWVIALINIMVITFYDYPSRNQIMLGWLIILTSIIFLIRVKRTRTLLFLVSIITYINISIAVIDCFYGGEMLSAYQWELRHSQYNQSYAKSILLNITIISLIMTPSAVKKAIETNYAIEHIERKNNLAITWVGMAFIVYALIFGYERTQSSIYVSNAKPLYEYAIMVFVMVWYYSKGSKTTNVMLKVFVLIYIIQGLYYGDRSSALVMMVLIGMVYINRASVLKMTFLGVLGIVFANIVAICRDLSNAGIRDIVESLVNRGALLLFSDTASYSYYAGITIVASRLSLPQQPIYYLYKFIGAVFLGSSITSLGDADITVVVRQVNYNAGGGLYPSYFYFWGEYIGIIVGAIILGFIIKRVFTKKSTYSVIMQFFLTVMCFRWYLYTPMTLYRTSLLVFSTLYLLCYVFNKITSKKSLVYLPR